MSRTIEKDGSKITASGVIIRGHRNKITGSNNIVYGDDNLGVGHGNRVYGDRNRWKGNYNILQGEGTRAKGIGNKRGAAAVMENRKRARQEDDKGKEEEDDDDGDDGDDDVRHQVVNVEGNNNVVLHVVNNRARQRRRTDDAPSGGWQDGMLGLMQAMRYVAEGREDSVPTEILLRGSRAALFPAHVRQSFAQMAADRALQADELRQRAQAEVQVERCMRVPGQDKERLDEEADTEKDPPDPVCMACLTNKRKTTNVPADDEELECGHHSYCITCARRAYSGKKLGTPESRCPVCRAQLSRVILSFVN